MAPDTAEDASTGSATGGMAAFLWEYGLIEEPKFVAEQGHWMENPAAPSSKSSAPAKKSKACQLQDTP